MSEARDVIATHLEGYGSDQPYRGADRLITRLFDAGFDIVPRADVSARTTAEFFADLPSDESLTAARHARRIEVMKWCDRCRTNEHHATECPKGEQNEKVTTVWCVMVRQGEWSAALDGVFATKASADARANHLRSAEGGYKRVQVWDMALQAPPPARSVVTEGDGS